MNVILQNLLEKKDLSSLQGIVFVFIIQHGELVISCKPAVTVMVV